MKGPSLDAIKKFKQLQEEKKKLEYDKKIQEKLTTLEHRAARGDKKAKTQLKQIEKIEEDRSKPANPQKGHNLRSHCSTTGQAHSKSAKPGTKPNRPKQTGFNFDELMKVAASNTNEVKREEKQEPAPREKRAIPRCRPRSPPEVPPMVRERPSNAVAKLAVQMSSRPQVAPRLPAKPMVDSSRQQPSASNIQRRPIPKHLLPEPVRSRLPPRRNYHDEEDYDDEEDDYYESDGFVVDDDDDEVRDELSKTLRSVFRYDKRRCDLREQELDRQYRAIGRVNTFEDLEREERRASRLAAAEDAEALRDLEERKRLKKQRLKGMRD